MMLVNVRGIRPREYRANVSRECVLEQITRRIVANQNNDSSDEQHMQAASIALANYLAGKPTETRLSAALASAVESPWALVGIGIPHRMGQTDVQEIQRITDNLPIRNVSCITDDAAILFISHAELHHLIDGIFDKGKISKYPMGISLPFDNLDDIHQQFNLINYCLEKGAESDIHNVENAALSFLKSEISAKLDINSLLHPALVRLARYDAANRSNLLNTLEAYLDNDRNAQQCANKLYLHRNSLQYRVRRIQEIAGINLDDPQERAYLRLSFLLRS